MKKPYQERRLEIKLKNSTKRYNALARRMAAELKNASKLQTQLDKLVAKRLKATATETANQVSFSVLFTRKKNIREIRGRHGWESSPGTTRKSSRRFATAKEAAHHGKRFTKIEGHKSFSVFRSSDPVNAKINWKTGKTNPIIGLGRTNR